jgi:hypothetical protein
MSEHIKNQKNGMLIHCSSGSEAQRTFLAFHVTLPTSSKLLDLI